MHKVRLLVIVLLVVSVIGGLGLWQANVFAHSHIGDEEAVKGQVGGIVGAGNGPPGTTSSWVKEENAKPGTDQWRLDPKHTNSGIEGYAGTVSAVGGQDVPLFISTKAQRYTVVAYRMGYYAGLGGRELWRSGSLPGTKQAAASVVPKVNTVTTAWKPSLTVHIASIWPPGDYLFKLTDSSNDQQYVPLTVRDDSSNAAYLIKNSVTTWQAYNLWGGYDLYSGKNGNGSSFANRARIVSFDRPYKIGDGSGDFLGNEFPLVSLAESLSLDVTYTTDVDFDLHPSQLVGHKVLLSLGHDEYWSLAMRNGALVARDAGVNIALFGANADYRHIRFLPSPLGPDRLEIDYKSAKDDPLNGKDNADVTVDWRDPPNRAPESVLNGDYYECNPVHAAMRVVEPGSWLFQGTSMPANASVAGVVGSEYDHFTSSAPRPPGQVEVFAHSPVTCNGNHSFSDVTYYVSPSGAGVFDSGTSAWIPALSWDCPPSGICPKTSLLRATQNVLELFGSGPAGKREPSISNLAQLSEVVTPAASSTTLTTATRVPLQPTKGIHTSLSHVGAIPKRM